MAIDDVTFMKTDEERELLAELKALQADPERRGEYLEKRNTFALRWQPLVCRVIGESFRREIVMGRIEDRKQDGFIGLLKAVDTFDPSHETKFVTYAPFWIRATIHVAIRDTGKTIRVPAHVVEILRKSKKAARRLGFESDDARIAPALGLTKSQWAMAECGRRADKVCTEADQSHGDRQASQQLARDTAAEVADAEYTQHLFDAVLAGLKPVAREVIAMRYGLEGHDPHTLVETAAIFGKSREWVRLIEASALRQGERADRTVKRQRHEVAA